MFSWNWEEDAAREVLAGFRGGWPSLKQTWMVNRLLLLCCQAQTYRTYIFIKEIPPHGGANAVLRYLPEGKWQGEKQCHLAVRK